MLYNTLCYRVIECRRVISSDIEVHRYTANVIELYGTLWSYIKIYQELARLELQENQIH